MSKEPETAAGPRVLICEDDVLIAKATALLLQKVGYEVTDMVGSGEEAVRRAEQAKPDVILMDITLGGEIDGIEAAEQISSRMDVPVVYLTGSTEEDVFLRAKKTGPYAYLKKPVGKVELRHTLETTLYKHEAERRVRESEERLRSTLDSLNDFVFVLNREGTFTDYHCPPDLTGRLYVPPEAFIGRGFQDVLPKNLARMLKESVKSVERTGLTEQLDYSLVIAGEQRWYSAKVSARRTVSGSFDGVTIVSRDVTDRKKAEDALRESEEAFRALFENSLDGAVLADPDGRILRANKAACEMFGLTEPELTEVGRSGVADLADPRLPLYLEEERRTGQVRGELHHKRKDGTIFPVEFSSSVFRNADSELRTTVVLRDVTERKKAEQALRERKSDTVPYFGAQAKEYW